MAETMGGFLGMTAPAAAAAGGPGRAVAEVAVAVTVALSFAPPVQADLQVAEPVVEQTVERARLETVLIRDKAVLAAEAAADSSP
jgi:hypothetical protein